MNRTFQLAVLLACMACCELISRPLIAQSAIAESESAVVRSSPTIKGDVVYGHKHGLALTLDIVQPSQPNGAAVIFVVSGGWNSRWFPPETYRRVEFLDQLVDKGYCVILLRHSSAPLFKVPDAVADVKQAVVFLGKNAAGYGFESTRIGVCGMSAGGHLSLMLGTATNQSKPPAIEGEKSSVKNTAGVAAVVAYFPPTDLRKMVGPSEDFPALDFDASKAEEVSPLLHVTNDDAPTLLVHGTRDRLVAIRQSQQIKQAFDENQVPCELLTIEGGGHGFRGDDASRAAKAAVDWFEKYLAPLSK